MAKFPEAEARLFEGMFVCRSCKAKIRAGNLRVLAGKVKCRKCGGKELKAVRKK